MKALRRTPVPLFENVALCEGVHDSVVREFIAHEIIITEWAPVAVAIVPCSRIESRGVSKGIDDAF